MDVEMTLLEHGKEITQLKSDVSGLMTTREFFKDMIERNIESNEKLSDTLLEVEKSMASMNEKMDTQTKTIESMKVNIENNNKQVNEQITEMKHQIDVVDDEGKFNIRTFAQKYLPWIVIVLGIGIYIASTIVKY